MSKNTITYLDHTNPMKVGDIKVDLSPVVQALEKIAVKIGEDIEIAVPSMAPVIHVEPAKVELPEQVINIPVPEVHVAPAVVNLPAIHVEMKETVIPAPHVVVNTPHRVHMTFPKKEVLFYFTLPLMGAIGFCTAALIYF